MLGSENGLEMYGGIHSCDMEEFLGPTNMLEYCGRTQYRRRSNFNRDPDYYHRRLFLDYQKFSIVHETDEAILFEVDKGQFWVPRKLLRKRIFGEQESYLVHKSFDRKYLKKTE